MEKKEIVFHIKSKKAGYVVWGSSTLSRFNNEFLITQNTREFTKDEILRTYKTFKDQQSDVEIEEVTYVISSKIVKLDEL